MRRPVSIIILTRNNLRFTRECVEAVGAHTEDYELVVVDNASTDGTRDYLQRLEAASSNVTVVLNRANTGFAAGCNRGVRAARHGTVCLLNNDVVARPGWLDAMRDVLEKGVGAVGSKLLLPDGGIQHAGIEFDHRREPVEHYWPRHRFLNEPADLPEANVLEEVPAVTAACLLTTKTVWERVNGMDEGYLIANFEDVDFNLAVRVSGLKVLYQPASELLHYWGTTVSAMHREPDSPAQHFQHNFERLQVKWFQKLRAGLADVAPPPASVRVSGGHAPLHVLITLLNFRSLTGSELHAYELSKELVRKGNRVSILSQIGGEISARARDFGIDVYDIRDSFGARLRPDVLSVSQQAPADMALRSFPGVPAVATVHSQFDIEAPWIDERIRAYVCVRPEVEEHLVSEHGIPRESCRVIYNPIDTRRFKGMPPSDRTQDLVLMAAATSSVNEQTMERLIVRSIEAGYSPGGKLVLFVGTIDALRRRTIEHLISRSRDEGFDLRIVGQRHESYLDGLSLPNVSIAEPMWSIERHLADADETAGVLLGRTTIEGWACGRLGWIYQIDDDGNILSFDVHEPPEDMSRFDASFVAEEYLTVYREAIGAHA